jgi:hypothetical protein
MSVEVAKEVELYEMLFDKAIGGFVVLWWMCMMNNVLLILLLQGHSQLVIVAEG